MNTRFSFFIFGWETGRPYLFLVAPVVATLHCCRYSKNYLLPLSLPCFIFRNQPTIFSKRWYKRTILFLNLELTKQTQTNITHNSTRNRDTIIIITKIKNHPSSQENRKTMITWCPSFLRPSPCLRPAAYRPCFLTQKLFEITISTIG